MLGSFWRTSRGLSGASAARSGAGGGVEVASATGRGEGGAGGLASALWLRALAGGSAPSVGSSMASAG
jgi:hypothetical protein